MSLSTEFLAQLQAIADGAIDAQVDADAASSEIRRQGALLADAINRSGERCSALWTVIADSASELLAEPISFTHGGYVFALQPGDTHFTMTRAPDLGLAFSNGQGGAA